MLPGMGALLATGGAASAGSSSYSAVASPDEVSGVRTSFGGVAVTVTSSTTTALVSGGTSPFTHSWAYKSGDTGVSPTTPTTAATAFSGSLNPDDTKYTVFEDTITDANGVVTKAECLSTLNHVDLR